MFKDEFNIICVMYIELYAKSESTKPRLGFEIRSLEIFATDFDVFKGTVIRFSSAFWLTSFEMVPLGLENWHTKKMINKVYS